MHVEHPQSMSMSEICTVHLHYMRTRNMLGRSCLSMSLNICTPTGLTWISGYKLAVVEEPVEGGISVVDVSPHVTSISQVTEVSADLVMI